MTYMLWDKKSPIYDVTAEQAMKNNPKYRDEDSYVFYRDDGSIYNILALSMIPNPDGLTSPDEICAAFITRLTAKKDVKSSVERITDLETENKNLKTQLDAETKNAQFLEDCIAEMAAVVYA